MSRTKRTDITQRLLDAMDGVALIMDDSLAIRQIGRPNWNRFLKENRCTSEALAANSINAIIGRQITAFGMRCPRPIDLRPSAKTLSR